MATRAEHSAQRQAFWQTHFSARAASGLSIKAYAVRHGLSAATYYAAQQRYGHRREQVSVSEQELAARGTARFARVVSASGVSSGRVLCRVRLANGARVELECDGASIESTLRVVAALS